MAFDLDPLVLVAILGLVNFVKALGAGGKTLTLISMGIGVLVSVLFSILPPDVAKIVLIGLLSGLGASGFYDLAGMFGKHDRA